ncbi:MAG TPA: S1C family serine protease [Acidimicrobiia bacterium]|jgi:serine protease Do
MGVLEEIGQAARAVAAGVGPAVVGIRAAGGAGSGVVVATNRVVTNAHNLRGPGEVAVTFADGRVATGQPLGVDVDGDLAVIEVDTGGAPVVGWSPGPVAAGEPVFALANPGGRGLRVSFGLVSAAGCAFRGPRGRRIAGGLEHTAPLPRGSSGGPVVDGTGRLVGINTHRLGDGVYLALPAEPDLADRLEALGRGDTPRRRTLGVGLVGARAARQLRRAVGLEERDGLLVRDLEDGGAGARAGLRVGDLIVAAGGRAVTRAEDLHAALDSGNDPLVLTVVRGAEELQVTVDFGDAG